MRAGLIATLLIMVIGGILAVFCLSDIAHNEVRVLPKWGWAAVVILSVPFGSFLYLAFGRTSDRR